MRPSRMPTSALMIPQWSRMTAPVMTVSGAPSARVALRLAHRLAEHLAAAEDGLVAGPARAAAAVLGDLDEQVGVGQPDPVAGGGAEQRGVARAGQSSLTVASCAQALITSRSFPGGFSDSPYTSRVPPSGTSETSLGDTGFEAHRGAGGDVEPVPVGGLAVELERRVGLRQVDVAADLHGRSPVLTTSSSSACGAVVERDVAVAEETSPGTIDARSASGCSRSSPPHGIGWWTVTSLVPSGKVASTWTS